MKKRFFCVEDRARIDSVLLGRPHRAAAQDCNAALEKRGVLHPPLPCFSFLHSIVRLFFCSIVPLFPRSFFLPCSLFFCSYFQGENLYFHPDRAPHRDSDHRDFSLNAASRIEQGKAEGAGGSMPESFEAVYERASRVFQRLCGIYREQLL